MSAHRDASEKHAAGIHRRNLMAATASGALTTLAMLSRAQAQSAKPADDARLRRLPPAEQPPTTERFVDIPGARLYVRDTGGAGAPIVLMHPASGSALIWAFQTPAFASAGHRVIAYSRRGYAKSSPFDKAAPAAAPRISSNLRARSTCRAFTSSPPRRAARSRWISRSAILSDCCR